MSPYPVEKSTDRRVEHYCIPCTPDREMTANELYTLKVSHAIYDIHWEKTVGDIKFFQQKGCQILPGFLSSLREHWSRVHAAKKRQSFNMDLGVFFKDAVKRPLPHDEIHTLINPSPTYLKFVEEGTPTPVQRKWASLSEEDKRLSVWEEAFTIALERWHTDHLGTAYRRAQHALITRLHPVWLADYALEHWSHFSIWSNSPLAGVYQKTHSDFQERFTK